jgi:DNA invertase Pin-like site-specific DNA recombinase
MFGRGKNAGWNAMLGSLAQADQVIIGTVGDLPGKTVSDLLRILTTLRHHHVGLFLHRECINSDDDAAAILDLITAYRAVKLSRAIRDGQLKALAQGRKAGRPAVPPRIQAQIWAALARGAGIRPTARRFGVSPASVINIRRMISVEPVKLAA